MPPGVPPAGEGRQDSRAQVALGRHSPRHPSSWDDQRGACARPRASILVLPRIVSALGSACPGRPGHRGSGRTGPPVCTQHPTTDAARLLSQPGYFGKQSQLIDKNNSYEFTAALRTRCPGRKA